MGFLGGFKLLPGKRQPGYGRSSFQQISCQSFAFTVFCIEKGVIFVKISYLDLVGLRNILFLVCCKNNGFVQTALVKFVHKPGFQAWVVHF